jgi:hypothetical protein
MLPVNAYCPVKSLDPAQSNCACGTTIAMVRMTGVAELASVRGAHDDYPGPILVCEVDAFRGERRRELMIRIVSVCCASGEILLSGPAQNVTGSNRTTVSELRGAAGSM